MQLLPQQAPKQLPQLTQLLLQARKQLRQRLRQLTNPEFSISNPEKAPLEGAFFYALGRPSRKMKYAAATRQSPAQR
jgi:hypothetical protein